MTNAPKYPLMAREFPDYDQATLPAIPATFADSSWHNNSAPSFESRKLQVSAWVDYAEESQREHEGGKRFTLCLLDERGAFASDTPAAESDDWQEILAHVIAGQFARNLLDELGSERFAQMAVENRGPDYNGTSACASHNYCDSNMAMYPAMNAVLGRDVLNDEGGTMSDADCDLWNAAWTIAKRDHITANDTCAALYVEAVATGGDLGDIYSEIESTFAHMRESEQ